jgi:Flp pilus assembly protein CpaB
VWFLVALACAGLAFVSVRALAARAAASGPARTVPVVVAARDLEAGSLLAVDDLKLADVPDPAPPASLTDPSTAVGALAVTPFVAGEPVTSTRLAEPAGPLVARVPPGLLGVTVTARTVPEGLVAGDRVDVLATYTSARPYTTTVATDVTVLDVPSQGGGFATAGGGRDVVLLASPEVARQLVQASATGVLAIAVRGYETVPLAVPADG